VADSVNKSRPVYKGLEIDPNARQHLFVLEGEGITALADRLARSDPEFLARSDVLYVGKSPAAATHQAQFLQGGLHGFWQTPTIATLLPRLHAVLAAAKMGSRLYVAGTEAFIGQVIQVALEFGIDPGSIRSEHRGSLVRRVQCVHCKGITEAVRTSPFTCAHCGLSLLVRDHYSRRIGAFQGVNIDAEAPGSAPLPEELYP
jgi:dimethylamine monooxygenase subunit C